MKPAASGKTKGGSSDEWFTPYDIISHAKLVLGTIDMDPASCREADETVRAAKYCDKATDGLMQQWHGNVWLNPPYSAPNCEQFVLKLIEQLNCRNTNAALLLVPSWTEYQWYQKAFQNACGMCLFRHQIKFFNPQISKPARPVFGSTLFYFGSNRSEFLQQFHCYGTVRLF